MNEPTISARSVSLPRRSLCQWVDTVTAETSGRVSMKISLRKWKCLRWLELAHAISWSHVRTEVAAAAGADLGPGWTRGDPHGPGRQCYTGARRAFWLRESRGREGGGGFVMR